MSESPSRRSPHVADPGDKPDRPWALGIGFLVLGLLVSSIGNAVALKNPGSDGARLLSNAIYPLGLLVAGWGVHRLIWVGPSTRPGWLRVLVTALVTVPAFALMGILLSVVLLMGMSRYG